ncbi:MAG: hypothetical protein ACK518_00600 [bacterium]
MSVADFTIYQSIRGIYVPECELECESIDLLGDELEVDALNKQTMLLFIA